MVEFSYPLMCVYVCICAVHVCESVHAHRDVCVCSICTLYFDFVDVNMFVTSEQHVSGYYIYSEMHNKFARTPAHACTLVHKQMYWIRTNL